MRLNNWGGLRRIMSTDKALVSLALQFVANGYVYSTYVTRLPIIRGNTEVSLGTLGTIITISNAAALVGGFAAPRLLARFSSRAVLVTGGLIYVLALPVLGLTHSVSLLTVSLVVFVLASIYVDVAINVQSAMLNDRRRTPVMSRLQGMFSLGTVVGSVAAATAAAVRFSDAGYLILVVVALVCLVLLVGRHLEPVDVSIAIGTPATTNRTVSVRSLVILAILVAGVFAVPLDIVPGEWATFRMTDDLNASPTIATAGYVVFTVGLMLGRLTGDFFIQKFGFGRCSFGGSVTSAVGIATATLIPSRIVALIGFFVVGLGISVLSPVLTLVAARVPGRTGRGVTVLLVGDRLAGLIVPVVVGTLADSPTLGVGAAMALVALPSAAILLVSSAVAIRRIR